MRKEGKDMGTPLKEYTKIDLYSMGYSVEEVARVKGITVAEVRTWIRRNGIQRGFKEIEVQQKEKKPKSYESPKVSKNPKNRKEKLIRELINW